jgi:hypothetical protein
MDKKDLKTRNYLYTINNYTKKDLKKFIKLAESLEKHRYVCFGLEVAPTTGTKHIHLTPEDGPPELLLLR